MYVAIFRAKTRALDAEYARTAVRMRELALTQFGCLAFHSVTQGEDEISLSYWSSKEAIRAWKAHPEHVLAHQAGQARWYAAYSVEVAEIKRSYANGDPSMRVTP
jgi:heme-degrading monooxygenase HmoA